MIYDYDTCADDFTVESDWSVAPDADPESMAYMFFADGGCWRYDFAGREGGVVPLPDGVYKAIAVNDDSAVTIIGDTRDGYAAMKATTCPSTLYASLGGGPDRLGDEAVMACPDQLWGSAVDYVSLTPEAVRWQETPDSDCESDSRRVLTFRPRPMMASYTYEITDVSNLGGVRAMCAAITGMASGLMLADRRCCGKAVTLPLGARRDGDDTVAGAFFTAGVLESETPANTLWLYVWLTDGRRLSYSFDVTRQARYAPDPMHVHIKVGGISLPESAPGGQGAFDVSVDGWIENIIDIQG